MNAENNISYLDSVDENLDHITMGEKNFNDSLVSFPPQGKSCRKSVFSNHHIKFRRLRKRKKSCMKNVIKVKILECQ